MRILLWFSFLFLIPVYIYPSGLPQIADYIMATLVALVALGGVIRTKRRVVTSMALAFAFVAYTFVVSATWSLVLMEPRMLMVPMYYLYNALAMVVSTHLHETYKDRFWRVTYWGLLVPMSYLTVSSLGFGGGGRFEGTFNNPNQLGYFAVLSTTIVYIAMMKLRKPTSQRILVLMMGLYLAAVALSRAAMAAMVLLIAIVAFLAAHSGERFKTAVAIVVVTALLVPLAVTSDLYERVEQRLTLRKGDESLAGRGYDRIFNNPHLAVLGAGEGALWRFGLVGDHAIEIHSTLGTILFSYGIPGIVLFFSFLWAVVKRARWQYAILLLPVFLYGLTHNGLRSTLLWVLFALIQTDGRHGIRSHVAPARSRYLPVPGV